MTWSNKKADCGNHIDRISDLPSNIIDDILQHLNIIEQVRTSILSRKWRHIWISIPQLYFGENFFRKCAHLQDHEISRTITEVLLVHNGPVYKFTLLLPSDSTISIDCLNKWLLFLSRSGIKDLMLGKKPMDQIIADIKLAEFGDLIQMPSHVFFCEELTYVKLYKFKISVPPNFSGFKSLLDLWFYCIRFDSGALDSLVSGCPLLKNLSLICCSGFECIDFSAPTLQVLTIMCKRVVKSICLKRAKNLIDLTLVGSQDKDERASVTNLISGLPQIQRLYMGLGYNEVLSVGTIPLMLRRSIKSLEYLKLSLHLNQREKLLYFLCLLESAPNLVELVIEVSHVDTQAPYDSQELERNSWCLSQLRTVKITIVDRFPLAMSLIRLILAISPLLETLTFHVGIGHSQLDASMLLSISEDLLLMERASQKAKIVFLHKKVV